MAVPYIFAASTSAIPLANLDSNFAYFANDITVSSGNVGIGTNSPSQKLDVVGSNVIVKSNASSGYGSFYANGATGGQSYYFFGINSIETARISSGAGNYMVFSTGSAATERMRIDSSGNVGIGTSLPSSKLSVVGAGYFQVAGGAGNYGTNITCYSGGGDIALNTGTNSSGYAYQTVATNHAFVFGTNNTERMRIDSSGNLLVGTTSGGAQTTITSTSAKNVMNLRNYDDVGRGIALLSSSANTVGSITWNASTTVYATSSDYRLKENIAPMTGALARVSTLKPVTYTWKADGSDGEGFIAHELAEVCPQAVVGEKDAVDAEGNPVYQGIDTSFLVATLTAAIQEQQALINELRARVAALESQP
jgi:hypothetical protein